MTSIRCACTPCKICLSRGRHVKRDFPVTWLVMTRVTSLRNYFGNGNVFFGYSWGAIEAALSLSSRRSIVTTRMNHNPEACAAYTPIFSPVATSLIGLGIVAAVVMSIRWSTGNLRRRQIVQHIQREPVLTPSSRVLRTVRVGDACQPPACCTYRRHRAACTGRGTSARTCVAYQPRACCAYRVCVPWQPRREPLAFLTPSMNSEAELRHTLTLALTLP